MNRIKCLRLVHGLSQDAFGKKFNVDQTAVSNWEKCKNSIDIKTLERIADEYCVPMEFVYGKEFVITVPIEKWHISQIEDYNNAREEERDFFKFKYGKGVFEKNELTVEENGEPDEDTIIFHRDGKTKKRKFTKEQMDMLMAMVDAIPETPKEDI